MCSFRLFLMVLIGLGLSMLYTNLEAQIVTKQDGNWNDATTWTGGVPGAADVVHILPGHDVSIGITADAAECDDLIFLPAGGAAPATLTLVNPGATLTINGDLVMNKIDANPGAAIESKISLNANTINVFGSVSLISGKENGKSHTQTIYVGTGTLNVDGDIESEVNNGVTNTIDLSSDGVIELAGNWNLDNNTTVNTSSGTKGTIRLNGTAQTVQKSTGNPIIVYYRLALQNSGTKTANGGVTVNGFLDMEGTAVLDMDGGALTYGDNALLEYKGGAKQTTGDELPSVVSKVKINNALDVNFNSSVTISNDLDLTNGLVSLGANSLIMADGSTISNNSSSSYVITSGTGMVRKLMSKNEDFTYPVGDVDHYSPVTITYNSGTYGASAYSEVQVKDEKHPENGSAGDFLTRYWEVNSNDITSFDCDWSATYDVGDDVNGMEGNLDPFKWNDVDLKWEAMDGSFSDGVFSASSVTSWSFPTGGEGGVLPIKLATFYAEVYDRDVDLIWVTSVEINNDFFILEKSSDSKNWTELERVDGAGNSSTKLNYNLTDKDVAGSTVYYRLSQVDFNGDFKVFSPIVINFADVEKAGCVLTVYPNPCVNTCKVKLDDCQKGELNNVQIEMYDASGKRMRQTLPKIESSEKSASYLIQTGNNLAPGIYVISAGGSTKSKTEKIIVK